MQNNLSNYQAIILPFNQSNCLFAHCILFCFFLTQPELDLLTYEPTKKLQVCNKKTNTIAKSTACVFFCRLINEIRLNKPTLVFHYIFNKAKVHPISMQLCKRWERNLF